MTRCEGCGQSIGAHENPHSFGDRAHYHPDCCPMCSHPEALVDVDEPPAAVVVMAKRGHRRGTPRAWALRGVGG